LIIKNKGFGFLEQKLTMEIIFKRMVSLYVPVVFGIGERQKVSGL